MEFSEVVRKRRMVRSYRPDPVPREALERILHAATRSPSAGFAQGQRFVVVTDQQCREAIAGLAGEPRYRGKGFEPWLSAAPIHVVLCIARQDYEERYSEPDKSGRAAWPVPYEYVDAGAALMSLLLAAVDEGFAAGFFGAHRLPGLSELLGIPPHVTPVGIVTIGKPRRGGRRGSAARGRKPVDELVRWESWD